VDLELGLPVDAPAVDERAVRRSEILDEEEVPVWEANWSEMGMPLLRERPSVMPASSGNSSPVAREGELVTISRGSMFTDSSNAGPVGRSRDVPVVVAARSGATAGGATGAAACASATAAATGASSLSAAGVVAGGAGTTTVG
jgi:hypothetical protein